MKRRGHNYDPYSARPERREGSLRNSTIFNIFNKIKHAIFSRSLSMLRLSGREVFRYVGIVFVLLICLGMSLLMMDVYSLLYKPMVIDKTDYPKLVLDKATSASSFVDHLYARDLIHHKRLFLALIRVQGLTLKLKAGVYQIRPAESAQQLLQRVVAGDVITQAFSIIEGTTKNQVSLKLKSAPYLIDDDNAWASITRTYSSAEGLLLADTYFYDAGSHSKALLEHAHKQLQHYLESSWAQRSPNLPYKSAYELLIAASILEKEASIPEERRLIGGIICNRLRKHMFLQMDPTVIYALGSDYKGTLSKADLHKDSPYNTYLYKGLPPTPIAMVGKEAIDAAAHPASTDYLYFVARGDGSHYFSVNYDEQKQAIKRYLGKK